MMTECLVCRELAEVLRRVNTDFRLNQSPEHAKAVEAAEEAYYSHVRSMHPDQVVKLATANG